LCPVITNDRFDSIMADSELPTRPKPEETPAAPAEGDSKNASKNALKKAAKEKAKAEKAAARAAQEKAQAAVAAIDTAKDLYGPIPETEDVIPTIRFSELSEAYAEKEVTVVARVDNARVQSAKLAFLMLRQQGQKIQAVIAAQEPISRQMIKYTGGLNVNSIVQITGLIKVPAEPISSASIQNLEIHIRKVYMISEAAQMLPMQVKDAERPPPMETNDDSPQVDAEGAPIVTLKTRLDNRVLDLQTETSQAITWISSGVAELFAEYMIKSGSRWIFTPKLVGSATEGGSNVFEVKYFKRMGYLAQSPQLYKQMCIAGDMENVFEIAPVFRAEDSNTHRHLTEVRSFCDNG
jgi:aspartyl/asparaginyl-tRNA synthetase